MPRARRTRPEAELQERDLAILQGLFESRLMTLNHITHLFFDGHGEAAKKRIQRLKDERLVGKDYCETASNIVYSIIQQNCWRML